MLRFLRLGGLRGRLMAAFGVFTFLVIGACLLALSYSIPFTESHLISENQYYTLKGIIDQDLANGRPPRLIPIKKLYASVPEVNGIKIPLIPEAYKDAPEGFSEFEAADRSAFIYRMEQDGVSYVLETDQTEFEEIEHQLGFYVMLFAAAAFALSLLLGWVLGQTVTRPVRSLSREVKRCAESSVFTPLSVKVDDDEVGFLAKTCESSLMQLHEMLERERLFASDLSHELRTDLAVVATTSELLEEVGGLSPRQTAQVGRIRVSAKNMLRLVNALLALNRGAAVRMADNAQAPLSAIASSVASEFQSEAKKKGLELEFREAGGESPEVPEGLGLVVVSNLVRNALRYTETGAIWVLADASGVTVKDTGQGIPQDELQKIFAPFFRGSGARGRGMGIGLSLVARICEREGWTISVSSAPGKGTEFRLGIPRRESVPPDAQASPHQA